MTATPNLPPLPPPEIFELGGNTTGYYTATTLRNCVLILAPLATAVAFVVTVFLWPKVAFWLLVAGICAIFALFLLAAGGALAEKFGDK